MTLNCLLLGRPSQSRHEADGVSEKNREGEIWEEKGQRDLGG